MDVRMIIGCSRCGGKHDAIDAKPLTRPFAPREAHGTAWTHWFPCPVNGEPVLLRVTADMATPPDAAPTPVITTTAAGHSFYSQLRASLVDNRLLGAGVNVDDAVEILANVLRADVDDRALDVANTLRNMRGDIERLERERDGWKRRAEQHGCDVTKGDHECG